MDNKIYIIWIGWIGISWIARYYLYKWRDVYGSDKVWSELIENLKKEWANIIIWENSNRIEDIFFKWNKKLVVYTEAVPKNQIELKKARELKIQTKTYPESLAEIVNKKKLITVAWTHGKSTTSSMISIILKNSKDWVNALVWSLLKEFDNKNTFFSNSNYFVLEACEYKRSFLKYNPIVTVIINIDLDHLDYYKDLEDYINAFKQHIDNVIPWGFVIINWEDKNCKKLIWLRKDINYIEVFEDSFVYNNKALKFPNIKLKIPGNHILFDAKLSYVLSYMIWIKNEDILKTLNIYNWIWRRMETIWYTGNNNILMSDYWHHPKEIKLTLEALKNKYLNKKILTIFQPHQYNRTLELLDDFKNSFSNTDKLIIPNIYESRDSKEDKKRINSEKLVKLINHKNKQNWKWLENTLNLINKYDKENPDSSIILLLWAWNIDNLRYKIKTV